MKLIVLTSLICLFSCEDRPKKERGVFQTSDPSRLYFQNLRISQYNSTRQAKTNIDLFKLRKYDDTQADYPQIIPVIVHNWMEDEAYLFAETNAYPITKPMEVRWENGDQEESQVLQTPSKENQRTWLLNIYEEIKKGSRLYIKDDQNNWVELLTDRNDQVAFMTTVQDYLKLTDQDI